MFWPANCQLHSLEQPFCRYRYARAGIAMLAFSPRHILIFSIYNHYYALADK